MKILILLLLSLNASAQLEVSSGLGASNKAGIVNGSIGFAKDNHHLYANQIVHLTNAANCPDIIGLRYGYWFAGFEPSVGIDYHLLSNVPSNDNKRGWQGAYGLKYKFPKVFIQAGASGGVYYGTVGIYRIK